ncbi:MAG TPA: glycoside hydrolase family 3 N-terminal domain-containing protein [Streptosporangiaceae bacterium]|nr:glycoside hydrolase family 3 N-terminal domain-containing protein [Streptosporangiaceae bacterium]
MTQELAADPGLGRLADAVLIPPFPGPDAPPWIRAALSDGLAGVTLFGPNVIDRDQLARLTGELRAAAAEPIIAIDEEGGDVTRISHQTGSDYPGNAALGAVDDVALTEAVYAALGADLLNLGINLNLAPAIDVNTAADNPVIGTRSFGADTALVSRHAAAAVQGLQSAGVAACAKHFPGHGSTLLDSHDVIVTVEGSLQDLRTRDLPPFEAAIKAGVRAIMPSHLRVPELTGDLPASLSYAALTGLLRGELGFTGVIVSDGLEMRAVSEPFGIPEAAVLAVAAGTDLLCLGRDIDQLTFLAVRGALVDAVRSGKLSGERLEEAAARVAELRAWTARAVEAAQAQATTARAASADGQGAAGRSRSRQAGVGAGRPGQADVPGQAGPADVGLAAARRALLATGELAPLSRPLVVQLVPPSNMAAGLVPWGIGPWLPAGSIHQVSTATAAEQLGTVAAELLAEAAGRSLIIVVRDAHRYPAATGLVSLLLDARPDAVVVEMGLPVWRPSAASYLASYGAGRSNALAVAERLGLAPG